jgi:S-adenosylmethionine hydrolase
VTRPIITLTSDFGLSDHFVGVMKGVILGIQPAAQLIDISHGVQAYDIADGAFTIRYLPQVAELGTFSNTAQQRTRNDFNHCDLRRKVLF